MGIFDWFKKKKSNFTESYFNKSECLRQKSNEDTVEDFSDVMNRYSEKKEWENPTNLSTGNDLFEDLEKASDNFLESYLMGYDRLASIEEEEVEKNRKTLTEKLDVLSSLGLTKSKTAKELKEKLDSYDSFYEESSVMDDRNNLIDTFDKYLTPYFLSFRDFIAIRDKYGYSSPRDLSTYTGVVSEDIIETLQTLRTGIDGLITKSLGTWKKEAVNNLLKPEQNLVKTGLIKNISSLNMFGDITTDLSTGCLVLVKDRQNGFYISKVEIKLEYWQYNSVNYNRRILLSDPVENSIFPIPENYKARRSRDMGSDISTISDPPYMSSTKGQPSLVFFPWQDGIIIIGALEV